MRYRKLTVDGDYSFGHGLGDFYIDQPEAVAQAVQTRLKLLQGEWFLNVTAGTPYATQILSKNKETTYDPAIRKVILDTQGVVDIELYQSNLSPQRELSVSCTINTLYGQVQISTTEIFPS